jgi:hypothetical protein
MRYLCTAALSSLIIFASGSAGVAQAQTVPPELQALSGIFRLSVTVGSGPGAFTDNYGLSDGEALDDFLDDSVLRSRYGARYSGTEQVTALLDLRGVPATAGYEPGSTTFFLRIPAADEPGAPYLKTFTGPTRAASYQAFQDYFDDLEDAEAERVIRAILRALAQNSPVDPVAGNPDSLQASLVRSGLDLNSGDSAIEGGAEQVETDPWLVGAMYSSSSSGRFSTDRIDARLQRSFRVLEGRRTLLKLEAPFTYSDTEGAKTYRAGLGVGLEIPIIPSRWSLEPRLAYGVTGSAELISLGHIVSASVASRYRIDGIGRGYLLIGNMIGYTLTLPTNFGGAPDVNPDLQNVVFRNGLAYEMPLKTQIAGRGASMRGSYTFTNYTGDDLYTNEFHEVTLSLGVRAREGVARTSGDLIRLNVGGVFGKDYDSYSLGFGFRF